MRKVIYGTFLASLILFLGYSYLFIDPNLSYLHSFYTGFSFNQRTLTTCIYIFFITVFFFFYFYILKDVKKGMISSNNVKKILLIIFSLLILSYPTVLSYDIFNYMTTSRVAFAYSENPYIIMPFELKGDSYLNFTRATNKTALYGPLWILLTALPYFLGIGNFFITFLLFKFLVSIFYGGVCYILWKLTRKLEVVVFFAFNPLVILETFVSGHNDVVMIFFILLSLYLLIHGRKTMGMLSFIGSILIKYATVFLTPVIVYILVKHYQKRKINENSIYKYSLCCMFFIFLLSPLREEMYPWYAIWLIPFVALVQSKKIGILMYAFSFGLMLRYIPYMLLGTYFGIVPFLRIGLMLVPLVIVLAYFAMNRNKTDK